MKPCPYCGKDDLKYKWDTVKWAIAVRCESCGAMGPVAVTSSGAEALWDSRWKIYVEPGDEP